MDLFLTPEEVISLTKRTRRDAQVKMLRHMGIEHRVRADGSVVILRSHIEKIFGGIVDTAPPQKKRTEPNWAAIS